MHPILCQIGPITIYSYGLMFALAVVVGTWLLSLQAQRKGINPDIVFDLCFWLTISGILGARIYYVFLYPEPFKQDPWEFFMLQHGGLAFQGSVLPATLVTWWYLKKHRLPVLGFLDLLAPYIALAHAIGRIGCLLNGCCYGKPVWWGLYFPVHEARLHPTQAYDTIELLIVFLILRKIQEASRTPGETFAFYLILGGLQRFINEFFRADHVSMHFGLSNFQIFSLVMVLAGLIMGALVEARKNSERK
jgi:phosphatidylglycerol:prolipoprotein diacylglycerol transferase